MFVTSCINHYQKATGELYKHFLLAGSEGAMFGHSVETPLIQAKASKDLK